MYLYIIPESNEMDLWLTLLPSFFTNLTPQHVRLTVLSLCECKLVFGLVLRRVYVRIIYSFMAKYLKFDWSIQVTWKQRAIENSRFVLASTNIRWYSDTKAVKYFSCYFLLSLPEKVDYFYETNYYCVILSPYLQPLAKVLHRKTPLLESLFNQTE